MLANCTTAALAALVPGEDVGSASGRAQLHAAVARYLDRDRLAALGREGDRDRARSRS
jgi:hypothetical protein